MAVDYKALKGDGILPQRQRGRFSVRLGVVGGRLSSPQLRAIADAAEAFGRGYAHLTSRQGVEIPFVGLKGIGGLKGLLAPAGLGTAAAGAAVRTVTACQGSKVCQKGNIDTYGLAKAFSERYRGRALPHKFKIGVTGCPNNCLKAEENDLGVKGGLAPSLERAGCVGCGACAKACPEGAIVPRGGKVALKRGACAQCGRCVRACPTGALSGEPGHILYFGGCFGNRLSVGKRLFPLVRKRSTVLRLADKALGFFEANGRPKERLWAVIARVGWGPFREALGLPGGEG
jgi:dissimilatory sulfite reductase (desulfoviridin) alpha/beta subunit